MKRLALCEASTRRAKKMKCIGKFLICVGTFIISYLMLMAYGLSLQWTLSLLAILLIGLGIYVGENDHD